MKTVLIVAANLREAKQFALDTYGENCFYISPDNYNIRGKYVYRFKMPENEYLAIMQAKQLDLTPAKIVPMLKTDEMGFFSDKVPVYINLTVPKSDPRRRGDVINVYPIKVKGRANLAAEVKYRESTEIINCYI